MSAADTPSNPRGTDALRALAVAPRACALEDPAAVMSCAPPAALPDCPYDAARPRCSNLALIDELRATIAELQRRTAVDDLTGVATRAVLEVAAGRELGRLLRFGHPVSLIYCDIDHFKNVNDSHGHAAGDAVLREFAQTLQRAARSMDLVARFGGEEFVMLLPNTGLTGGRIAAEKLRGALARTRFPVVGALTASLGVAQAVPGESWNDWLGRADAAMYEAKLAGRDRVAASEAPAVDDHDDAATPGFLHLVWREAFGSGHPVIDRQHRGLFATTNEFLGAAAAGDRESSAELLSVLLADCRQHFADEERILHALGYEELDDHAALHVELLAQAAQLAQGFVADTVEFGTLVTFLARDLVAGHMLRDDRALFPLLATAGGRAPPPPPPAKLIPG